MGGWGAMDDDDDANCPYGGGHYGRHMGRWSGYGKRPGYGKGPGMMGDNNREWDCPYGGRSKGPDRGYGMMGRDYGMGSEKMMGRGYGMGSGYGRGPDRWEERLCRERSPREPAAWKRRLKKMVRERSLKIICSRPAILI